MVRKYRVGVTTEEIVRAAQRLTRLQGLDGWSIRELVADIGTSPSVVYHRVGDRSAVCARVVLRALAFPVEPTGADWRSWFVGLLLPLRAALLPYPGVARWILLHGVPTLPGEPTTWVGVEEMDRGFALLREAGFGDDAGLVFALVMNSALTTIALGDDRLAHPGDGAAGHTSLKEALRARGDDSVFATGLGAYVARFGGADDAAEEAEEHYYRTMITTILDGVAARLD